jgi:Flp pilus assembly protein TadD
MGFTNAPSDDELDVLRGKVARYPTDPQLHFALGAALFARGDYDAAIPELHGGVNNPRRR